MAIGNLNDNERLVLAHIAQARKALYDRIKNIHGRPLHPGQVQLAKSYFEEKKKVIMAQYGRGCGKTESILFVAWMKALMEPGSLIYIICKERKQAREIYWASGRLQHYGPPEYLDDTKSSELRAVFKNGSFIALDGCDNVDALRGVKPSLVFYDEFQHHSKEFDQEVMRPNLGTKGAALIICGTPPKRECYYTEFKKRLQTEILEGDTTRAYFELPSSINPAWDKSELAKIERALIAQKDEAIWRREYLGEDCLGGAEMVFPLWNIERYKRDRSFLEQYLYNDKSKLRWITACDPGTSTVFAVIFCCYNPFTCQFFVLDEIYEKDRKRMDTRSVWNQIRDIEKRWNPDGNWRRIADEAAAWFRRELHAQFHVPMSPTRKSKFKKDSQISMIKMMMATENCLFVNDACKFLDWELKNCVTDDEGDRIDENDHLIDSFDYALQLANFKFTEKASQEAPVLIQSGDTVRYQKVNYVDVKNEDWATNVVEDSLNPIEAEWYN